MRHRWAWVVALPTCIILGVFLIWPLGYVFHGAVTDVRTMDAVASAGGGSSAASSADTDTGGMTARYLLTLVQDPEQLAILWKTTFIAIMVTLACSVIAFPLAWIFARRRFAGKALFSGLLLVPLILPPFVGAVGMRTMLSRAGPLSMICMKLGLTDGYVDWLGAFPLLGIVLLEALHLFPILYLNMVAAFSNIDPTLEEAARNSGAGPWRVFRRVTLPLSAPGCFAGLILIFIWSFTELGTPLVFGVRDVLPVRIFYGVSEIGTNPLGYAQVVLVLVVTVVGFLVSKMLTRRGRDVATLGRISVQAVEKPMGRAATLAVWVGLLGVIGLALLPHAGVVALASFRRWFLTILPEGATVEFYSRAMGDEMTRQALYNSMGLSVTASMLDLLLGFGIAWLCVRARVRGADWLDALAMLPLAVPGLVIAFGYVGCFSRVFPETWIDPHLNPMPLLAMSYAVRRLPYMVRSCHAGLEQVSVSYEEAASNCGASAWRVIRRITLPLISANLLAGGILCFSFSMLEVSDSLILAQSQESYPITKAIYTLTGSLDNGINVASALGMWAMLLLGCALIYVSVLMGKRAGRMFRAG